MARIDRRLFRRGRIWYTRVPKPGGGTRPVSTNCTDQRAALKRIPELERAAIDPDGEAAAKATLREALELLIRDRASQAKAGKKSVATVKFYREKSAILLDGLAEVLKRKPGAPIYLRETTGALFDDWVAQRRDDGAKEHSIHKEMTTWRAALRLAKRRRLWFGDLDEVFPRGFSTEYEARTRFLHPEELLPLYRAMVRPIPVRQPSLAPDKLAELRARRAAGEDPRALAAAFGISLPTVYRLTRAGIEPEERPAVGQALFAIVCYSIATGAEWSAIWRARREDIAPDLTVARVRGSKNDRRDANVPITLYPFGLLLRYALEHGDGELVDEEGAFLFSGTHASSFRHRLAEACKRAGIAHLSPNDLRRTHGKWLRLAGVEPSVIGPTLRHADDRMAQLVYAQSTGMELALVARAQIEAGGGLRIAPVAELPPPSGGDKTAEPLQEATKMDGRCAAQPNWLAVKPTETYLGVEGSNTWGQGGSGATEGDPRSLEKRVAWGGIEPSTRGFSVLPEAPENTAKAANPGGDWDANGRSDGSPGTGATQPPEDGPVPADPPLLAAPLERLTELLDRVASRLDAEDRAAPPPIHGAGAPDVERALATALGAAAAAGRFDVVAQLARELEARRLAGAGNVVSLEAKKRGRQT